MILGLKHRILHKLRTTPRLGRFALRCIPDSKWIINVRTIGNFQIRLRRNRSYWLRDPLAHESFMLGALKRMIRPGDVVYDVGANIGLYSRFLLNAFQAGQVVSFEPMTANLEMLRSNIRLGLSPELVRIIPVALSDNDGIEELEVDDVSSASAVLSSVSGGAACESRRQYGFGPLTERVKVCRLDTLFDLEDLPNPSVVKIDIEGAEALMLAGRTNDS